jgi:hypothetical protein
LRFESRFRKEKKEGTEMPRHHMNGITLEQAKTASPGDTIWLHDYGYLTIVDPHLVPPEKVNGHPSGFMVVRTGTGMVRRLEVPTSNITHLFRF